MYCFLRLVYLAFSQEKGSLYVNKKRQLLGERTGEKVASKRTFFSSTLFFFGPIDGPFRPSFYCFVLQIFCQHYFKNCIFPKKHINILVIWLGIRSEFCLEIFSEVLSKSIYTNTTLQHKYNTATEVQQVTKKTYFSLEDFSLIGFGHDDR